MSKKGRIATWSYPANSCPAGPSEDYRVPPVDHDWIGVGEQCPGCGLVVNPSTTNR